MRNTPNQFTAVTAVFLSLLLASAYNLATDPGQTTNLAASEPQRATAMQERLNERIARPKPAAKPRAKTKPAFAARTIKE
jgi:hypothetical protein